MGDYRTYTQSFGGGEVTPEFFGRLDDQKRQTGLAVCRNFIVAPHGIVRNRPGTKFVREVRNSAYRTRTLPFTFSFDQTLVIEFSVGAFRFHSQGQTLLDGATPYEVPHTYTEDEIPDVTFDQSGDVMTLAHRNHPPRELRRMGAIDWELVDIAVGPVLDPPTGVGGSGTAGATPGAPFDTEYVITSLSADGDESLESAIVTISNNLYDDGAYNTITWLAAADAERYNVYKRSAGLFGFIGQTDQLQYRDDNIAPDLGTTPPLDIQVFQSPGNYPGAVARYEQRRAFAGTTNEPQNVWLTRSGTETNFNYSIPPKDDDSVQFKVASREANSIRHLVPMAELLAMTPSAIWRIGGGLSEVLTPLTLVVREQTFVGASSTKPAKIGNNLIYVASRGGHLRELGYDGDRNGYVSGDVSIRAPHLFDDRTIMSMTVEQAPYPIVWAVSSSGELIGLTYIPEQGVGAFHRHDTLGAFEDATTINEDGRDVTYLVVKRTINGQEVRYIEYFENRLFVEQKDQYFVDCGATYSGAAVDTLTGLTWLEGQEVAILADGAVQPRTTVVGGEVSLPTGVEAETWHVGLPFTSDLQTLPVIAQLPAYGQGMPKNINKVLARVYRSAGLFAGPSFDELVELKYRTTEPMGSPPRLLTEEVEIQLQGAWDADGAVCIRNEDPTGLTVLSMTVDFAVGGG